MLSRRLLLAWNEISWDFSRQSAPFPQATLSLTVFSGHNFDSVGATAMATASSRDEAKAVFNWLVDRWQWPAATLFAAYMLLALTPVWIVTMGATYALVLLQLPIYMVHQFEEHAGDRFRKYVNEHTAHCEALTKNGTFVINSVGVWGLDILMIYLAVFVNPMYALAAFYLPLINGTTHIVQSIIRREYNPGLWTSIVLFLPLAGWGLYYVSRETAAPWTAQALGLGIALAVHAAIIVYVVSRVRRLRSAHATA
jgi:hypothetical protein